MVFRQVFHKLSRVTRQKIFNDNIKSYSTASPISLIEGKPLQIRFATLKVCLTVFPFLLLGATISKNGARILEEQEIFVPEDDEDD